MAFGRRDKSDKITTVIGSETEISGVLVSNGTLRIDGKVQGEVQVNGDIIVGEGAVIEASVKGFDIQVAGKIRGDVEAAGKLEIQSTGAVEGDVVVNTLQVADGALFQGKCQMMKQEPQHD